MNRIAEACMLLLIGAVTAYLVATASVKMINNNLKAGAELVIQSEHMNK